MNKHLLVLIILFLSTICQAQKIIEEIEIKGLHPKTAKFCQRFIVTEVKDTLDIKIIQQDVQNLLNLRLFSEVTHTIDTVPNGVKIIFNCNKILTFLPIINLGSVKGNIFYQLGFRDLNFFKRKGIFRAYDIVMDNKHSIYLDTEIPYISHSKLGFTANVKWTQTIEPIYLNENEATYDLTNTYYSAGIFYEFTQNHRLYMNNAWYKQSFQKQNTASSVLTLPDSREDKGYQVNLQYKNNKVNYKSLYLDGWNIDAELKTTFGQLIPVFMQGIVTGTFYKKIKKKGDFATRLKMGITSKKLGSFGPFSLDSYLNLRGAGRKTDRGTGQLVLNTEYRQTILESKNICIQTVIFSDLGTWRTNLDSPLVLLTGKTFKGYSGLGTRFFITRVYDLVFRIDYGISMTEKNKSGFVLGLGQYF